MAKLSPPARTAGNKKIGVKTSLRVPKMMLDKMEVAMIKDGFNKKQRTTWINLAIHELLLRDDYTNLIAEEFIEPGTTRPIPLDINYDLIDKIEHALEQVARQEGVKAERSALLRTAIIQKIMASKKSSLVSPKETLKRQEQETGAAPNDNN